MAELTQCQNPKCGAYIDGGEYCDRCKKRNKAEPEVVTMLDMIEQTRRIKAKVAELQADNARLEHAINMMRHDMAQANRIHNQQMNDLEQQKDDIIVARTKEIAQLRNEPTYQIRQDQAEEIADAKEMRGVLEGQIHHWKEQFRIASMMVQEKKEEIEKITETLRNSVAVNSEYIDALTHSEEANEAQAGEIQQLKAVMDANFEAARNNAAWQLKAAVEAIVKLHELNETLVTEIARGTYAFNMLQAVTIDANRLHNKQMNDQAEEIERLRAACVFADEFLDTIEWNTDSSERDAENVAKELKNALGGPK